MSEENVKNRNHMPYIDFGPPPKQCPKIVETDTIRNYMDENKELKSELSNILDQMLAASNTRDGRHIKFMALTQGDKLSKAGVDLLKLITGREATHIYFMAVAWAAIYELQYKKKFPGDRPWHDCSKDLMFMFIMAAHYDLKLGHQALPVLVEDELRRHYTLEPHHPEHERETGTECQETDILEMAVDRMARNMQFDKRNDGLERMKKHLPKFFSGDVVKKEQQYWKFVEMYFSEVRQLWEHTYGDQLCI